jgi:tRNA-2-methylthio-N6-dimethylallyladenosine synthase
MKYHIVTFGCAANEADSERIASYYQARGYKKAKSIDLADTVVINTCMIRQKAEDRVYGLVHNLTVAREKGRIVKIVITGCMVGMTVRDNSEKLINKLRKKMPSVDEFLPIEEVGFENIPVRSDKQHALVPISNGCNNFCTYCVVPFSRGREISRPYEEIVTECKLLIKKGYTKITLIGQNVNSYGSDIIKSSKLYEKYPTVTYVKHLGRLRIPTLFPSLLAEIAQIKGIKLIDFISSNPWDFSDDLIEVIVSNPKISRHLHLPVQSGDNQILKKMNRWYTREEYLELVTKLRSKIPDITISTDIIVGFCGETKEQFNNTVNLSKKIGFSKAYISMYSDRPMTAAHKVYIDNVTYKEKKRRWMILDEIINKTNLKAGTYY